MSLEAWFMDSSDEDQRKPHRLTPNQPVSLDELKTLGVFYWKVTAQLTANLASRLTTINGVLYSHAAKVKFVKCYICTVFIYKASYTFSRVKYLL